MANQQGFSIERGVGSVAKLLNHLDRTKLYDKDGNLRFAKYDNLTQRGSAKAYNQSDIDPSRTHLNYNLAKQDQPENQRDFIAKRVSEVYAHKSALRNGIVDWVITLPPGRKYKGREREFFENAYGFCRDRYGAENVVSAYVHMDETTPHMHFCFVPVAVDDKHAQGFKLSRKAVNTCERIGKDGKPHRDTVEFSKQFHADLERHVCETMGFDHAGIELTEEEKAERKEKGVKYSRTLAELKEKSAELAELKEEIAAAEQKKENLEISIERRQEVMDGLDGIIARKRRESSSLDSEIGAKRGELDEIASRIDKLLDKLAKIREAVGGLLEVRKHYAWVTMRKVFNDYYRNPVVAEAAQRSRDKLGNLAALNKRDEKRYLRTSVEEYKGSIEDATQQAAEEQESIASAAARNRSASDALAAEKGSQSRYRGFER